MISSGSRLTACCKLAPALARQMWRHNYVIDRNEYLIFTFSESVNPWVYSLQFLFKSSNNSWRYERKCEWVFFFWTQCTFNEAKTQKDTVVQKFTPNIANPNYQYSLSTKKTKNVLRYIQNILQKMMLLMKQCETIQAIIWKTVAKTTCAHVSKV